MKKLLIANALMGLSLLTTACGEDTQRAQQPQIKPTEPPGDQNSGNMNRELYTAPAPTTNYQPTQTTPQATNNNSKSSNFFSSVLGTFFGGNGTAIGGLANDLFNNKNKLCPDKHYNWNEYGAGQQKCFAMVLRESAAGPEWNRLYPNPVDDSCCAAAPR